MTDTSLRIVAWNANGLAKRSRELEMFLRLNNIDIALISETHFTDKSYLKIYGFMIYYTTYPSGRAHAATAIIIKNNIEHFQQAEIRREYIQSTIITIKHNRREINIAAAYCPPRHNIKKD